MTSNFKANGTDLDDIFAVRGWFKTGGSLWAWGSNGYFGLLGLNDTIGRSSPTQVGNLAGWKSVSASISVSTFAIKTDGTLWAWGYNLGYAYAGQLGLNDTIDRSSPTQVGNLTNWKSVSAGSVRNSFASKTDGTLWAWGNGANGRLGLNNLINRSSPTQVGILTDWKIVASPVSGGLAIKTDGTLWAWGLGTSNLGLNDTIDRSSPTQVGNLTNWKSVSTGGAMPDHTLAIKTDGTLWAWGYNGRGSLGLNNLINRSSPTQVGILTDWKNIVAGEGFQSSFAIKNDGTLWAWGSNGFGGRLGLNDTTARSSPTQVGNLTNWKSVSVGYHTLATKTDGTLWAWGYNRDGRLGIGTEGYFASVSSPVQVGSSTNWRSVAVGYGTSFAIKTDGPLTL